LFFRVYSEVRAVGGVCVADEVQVKQKAIKNKQT